MDCLQYSLYRDTDYEPYTEFLILHDTVNPLYTDTRYNDKFRYNDNLNVTKPLLKKRRLMRNYAKNIA